MKTMLIILRLFLVLLTLFLWGSWFLFRNPVGRVAYASNEELCNSYLLFYEKALGEREFNGYFLEELITMPERHASLLWVCRFAGERGRCELLPYIEAKCAYFDAMPQDTVIPYTLYRFYNQRKVWHYSHHQDPDNLCVIAERLRETCGIKPEE